MARKKREMVIRDAEQLRALRTPLRQEIVRSFMKLGACTVGELADDMGKQAAALYYHVHALEEAGLAVETGKRSGEGRPETVYSLAAERILIDRSEASPSFRAAVTELNRATLRTAERELAAAVESRRGGGKDHTSLLRLASRLRPRDAARAAKMMREVIEFMSEHDDEAGDPFTMTSVFVRIPERPE